MTQQTASCMQFEDATPSATGPGELVQSGVDRRRSARARGARFVLAFGVAASLAAGGWGIFSSLGVEAEPARLGEVVEVSGGLVRVDAVTPEHMAQMQADKFAASGMNMSSMGMDMAPEGQRRFSVEVALAAKDGALNYSPQDFRITGDGIEEIEPLRETFEGETIPAGGAVSGSLVFQVPEDAQGLELGFDGGRPISLELPPTDKGEAHSHGAPAEPHEDGHEH